MMVYAILRQAEVFKRIETLSLASARHVASVVLCGPSLI